MKLVYSLIISILSILAITFVTNSFAYASKDPDSPQIITTAEDAAAYIVKSSKTSQ